MPRREQRIAVRVAAAVLHVLHRAHQIWDPEEDEGAAESCEGHDVRDAPDLVAHFRHLPVAAHRTVCRHREATEFL